MVCLKSLGHYLGIVVASDGKLFSADALVAGGGGIILGMIGSASFFADAAAAHTPEDLFIGYLYAYYVRDIHAHFLKRCRLGNRAGKSVQNEAVGTVTV